MAHEIEVGDIEEEAAAPEARWSKVLTRVRSLPRNFNDDDYFSHPIFENMREQEMGKFFLGVVVPALGVMAYLRFNDKNSNEIFSDLIFLVLCIGGVALFVGLFFRSTFRRRVAPLLELLGIVCVCLSVIGLFASLLSGPLSRIIFGFCAALLVLLPFIIPFLPRENDSNGTN